MIVYEVGNPFHPATEKDASPSSSDFKMTPQTGTNPSTIDYKTIHILFFSVRVYITTRYTPFFSLSLINIYTHINYNSHIYAYKHMGYTNYIICKIYVHTKHTHANTSKHTPRHRVNVNVQICTHTTTQEHKHMHVHIHIHIPSGTYRHLSHTNAHKPDLPVLQTYVLDTYDFLMSTNQPHIGLLSYTNTYPRFTLAIAKIAFGDSFSNMATGFLKNV